MANSGVNRKPPVAPPVYRPQPLPKVLQTKNSSAPNAPQRLVGPPAYRPQVKPTTVQAKMAGPADLKKHTVAPPIYKPQATPKVLQTKQKVKPPSVPASPIRHNTIQRVKGLTENTYVEVSDERGIPWYGQIVSQSGGSYKIRIGGGGDSDTVDVPEARVGLHPTFKHIYARAVIKKLDKEFLIFRTRCKANLAKLSPTDKLVFHEIETYLVENNVQTRELVHVHDGAKKTLVASGAREVLKLYYPNSGGVYTKEKQSYELLQRKGADMRDFVRQWGWNDLALTARADNLRSSQPPGPKMEAASQILERLKEVGLCLNDLQFGDNVGTSMDGRAVVFDVKSLVELRENKSKQLPIREEEPQPEKELPVVSKVPKGLTTRTVLQRLDEFRQIVANFRSSKPGIWDQFDTLNPGSPVFQAGAIIRKVDAALLADNELSEAWVKATAGFR